VRDRPGLRAGGTLSPGESPGILSVEDITFAAGSILNMELGGTVRGGGYDALVSSGGVVLQDGSRLSVSLISSFVPETGDEFDLLDFSSLSGRFTTINLPALAGGLSWSTDELYLNGTIGVTPEPATLALLALGSLGMLVRRRRKYSALKPQLGQAHSLSTRTWPQSRHRHRRRMMAAYPPAIGLMSARARRWCTRPTPIA
jgi:hypothetical protein